MIKFNFKQMLMALSLSSMMLFVACGSDDDPVVSLDPPEADFSFTIDGADVTFTNGSTGDILTYAWDFGDGASASTENATHTYTEDDTYSVSLTVVGPGGEDTNTQSVTIDTGGGPVEDTTAPVITLIGDSVVFVDLGATYEDPGVTATDNEDGELTANVVVAGDSVNTSVEGDYVVTYNVSDAAGNAAEEVSRTVVVVATCDTDAPQTLTAAGFNMTHAEDPTAVLVQDNVAFTVVDNPDADNEVNPSCKVGEVAKSNASPFDNLQVIFDENVDFCAYAGFKMKIYTFDPDVNVTMKMENTTPAGSTSDVVAGPVTATETWEELTFPFPAEETDKWNKLVIFFDLGDQSEKAYIIDDLMLYDRTEECGGGGGTPATFPLGFEDGIQFFEAFEGAAAEIVANPDQNGNTSANVLQLTKNGQWFAGLISQPALQGPTIDMANGKVLKVDVWSPKANQKVRVRLQASNGGPDVEVIETQVNANEWTTMTFDFSSSAAAGVYSNLVINTDFDAANAPAGEVYYIDNIVQEASGGGGGGGGTSDNLLTNGDFETGDLTGWLAFPNGGTSEYDGTRNNGGSGSGRITLAAAGNPALKQERFGGGTVAAGDVVRVQFDINGVLTPPGAVANVLLFGEQAAGGASFTHVFNPAPVLDGTWTTFTADYTIPSGLDVGEGLSLLIEGVCGADAGCAVEFNIDNVSLTLNP